MARKTLCLFFVLLHLLNVVGGYWLFHALRSRNSAEIAQNFDAEKYAGSRTITVKLPLSFPVSDNENYERIDGEFTFEGNVYRMIKQKFYRDTAYIVCYDDDNSTALNNAMQEYVKTFAGDSPEKKSEDKTTFSVIKDYLHQHSLDVSFSGPEMPIINGSRCLLSELNVCGHSVDHPPRVA